MRFKKDHPTFSGIQLCEAIEEPMVILATGYRMHKTEAKPGGFEDRMHTSADIEDSIKPCEEEMKVLEWLNSTIAKTMSRAGAMWLEGALEQRLETEPMSTFRDAMPDD